MPGTDRVLAAIDDVLEDWESGEDAAAWYADGGPDELEDAPPWTGMQGMHPTLVIYDEVADFGRSMQAFAAAMNPVIRQWAEGFRKISAVMSPLAHAFAGPYDRKHRARCRYCTPDANQGPLCIDGHEYRRRQRARRRRR